MTALMPPIVVYTVQTNPVNRIETQSDRPVTCCIATDGVYNTTAM